MGETIAVLIIFFFLIVLGVAFYINVSKSKVYSNQEEIFAQDSIKVSQTVSFLPELQCSSENIVDDNCYDLYKLAASKDHILNNVNFYFPFFLNTEIEIKELYPNNRKWLIYNNTGDRDAPMYTNVPISLYNATTKRYSFGVLTIAYFPYYG